ncbi:hypothetical protein KP509_07G038900 [Ceratopteris richardii]|uniref:CCHC-type domain-containing protein n=1 Tax=Ceratopteris richardii TaxID=49495 RepID=A0A8T2UFY1_CERRI|nr:hypothetical protein KP509_07G038900 [Ceratopteris richardii]
MDASVDEHGTVPVSNASSQEGSENHVVIPQTPLQKQIDIEKLKCMMEDALTHDVNIKGDLKVDIDPALIWESALMFHERGVLLFFTGRIPLAVDVAYAINANVGNDVVGKVFYFGHGLFEVIFNDNNINMQFLEQQTVFLCGLVAHVSPWKPVKAMKEELLFKCLVWVKLVDLPSFLWNNIGHVAKALGKVLYTPSISAPNKNRVCVLWNTSRPFPKTLSINIPSVGNIVIYLKWGNMAGSCFHCGNLGHYSKNCPSLKTDGVNLIPTYPGSKILVPEEQIFGKQKLSRQPAMPPKSAHDFRSPDLQELSHKGKEVEGEKQNHHPARVTPVKLKFIREGRVKERVKIS